MAANGDSQMSDSPNVQPAPEEIVDNEIEDPSPVELVIDIVPDSEQVHPDDRPTISDIRTLELAQAIEENLRAEAFRQLTQWFEEEKRLQKINDEMARLASDARLRNRQIRTWAFLQKERKELEQKIQNRNDDIDYQVKGEVKKLSVRERLCPVLKRGTDDVFDITKSSVPVLITLAATGVISISTVPAYFVAGAALLIARMSVANYCSDEKLQENQSKKHPKPKT